MIIQNLQNISPFKENSNESVRMSLVAVAVASCFGALRERCPRVDTFESIQELLLNSVHCFIGIQAIRTVCFIL